MEMTFKDSILAIQKAAREQGKSDEFFARAVIFWMDWDLNLSISGNGWLDDDQETRDAIEEDDDQVAEFQRFILSAGIVGWYNKDKAQ